MPTDGLSRRRLLALAGVAGVGGLAGCSEQSPTTTRRTSTTGTTAGAVAFALSDLSTPADVTAGDPFDVSVGVRNRGDVAGETTVVLELEAYTASKRVALDPGETERVAFSVPGDLDAQSYALSVFERESGAEVTGEVVVSEPVPRLENFVGVEGTQFVVDGERFRFNGANNDMLARTPRWYVDRVFEEAAALGLNALRTWVYAGKCYIGSCAGENTKLIPEPAEDGSDARETLPELNETVLERLDYAIYRANETGVRLVLPLLSNTDSHTGITDFVRYSASASDHDDFYTDERCRRFYRTYVERILTRENTLTGREYRDDPGILLWELVNEPDLLDNDGDTALMDDWIGEMAAYLKSVDDTHPVSTGEIGMYEDSNPDSLEGKNDQGMAFLPNHRHDAIDAATVHMHPSHMGFTVENDAGVERWKPWVANHARDAREELGKPLYVGEFSAGDENYTVDRRDGDWERQDERRANRYREIFGEFREHDVDGALTWTFMIPFDYATDPVDDPDEWNAGDSVYPRDTHSASALAEYSNAIGARLGHPVPE
ncbi:cellulase family glycosylhydrolase [Salarchaeum japonicum]|uniref:mannan endo-1,4-beta-mannosidase n=1 Tax=Salarchaeum japonicum TaxID=555573 RepID=A0AAV3T291_9EURY|nr:cellulase family glycosylhydrolase [Salarchaeum japonicum]